MKLYLLVPIALFALAAGCDRRNAPETQNVPEPSPPAETQPMPEPAMPVTQEPSMTAPAPADGGDALALGLLGAINDHEVAAAQQAKEKQVTGDVLAFADEMLADHGTNQAKTMTLGAPTSAGQVQVLKDKGAKELAELGQKSGKEYEAAYVDAMVKGHQEALGLIDNQMIPAATTDPVKQHLTQTREHVQTHLTKAQDLQSTQKL